MKQLAFTIKTSLILILSVIVFSCCQQEDSVPYAKVTTSPRYLTVEPGFLSSKEGCFCDSNYTNLYEAFERAIGYKNQQIYLKISDAKEANMSVELFNYFNSLIDISFTTRTTNKANNDKSDCTACTIAAIYSEMFENKGLEKPIYNAIWKYICNHYDEKGLEWDAKGANFRNLLLCCFEVVQFHTKPILYNDTIDKEDDKVKSRLIAIVKEDEKTYHSVTVLCIAGNGLLCRDEQMNMSRRIVELNKTIAFYYVSRPKTITTTIQNLEK